MIEVHDAAGRLVSRNTVIEEAIEDLTADAEAHPETELYRITYPEREVRIVPRAVVVPVPNETLVQGAGIQFTQGQAGTFDLGAAIAAAVPSGHVVTSITPNKTLPSGVSADLANVEVDYDGAGAVASVGTAQDPLDLVVVTQQNSAELDWQGRIAAPGVVWYHDFRSDAEVNQFRWASAAGGNDPTASAPDSQYVRRVTSDGIAGGGCLEYIRPAGTFEPDAAWWRPWFPISGAQNGRGVDDPGNGIALRNWTPAGNPNALVNAPYGYYGNSSYHAAHPGQFDGTEFWLQMRVKVDYARAATATQGGKILYMTTNFQSLTSQEIVLYPDIRTMPSGPGGKAIFFRMYRSGGSPLDQDPPGDSVQGQQPYSDLGTCNVVNNQGACWYFSGGWDTVMWHIRPGLNGNNDTLIEVWAANPGQPKRRIWYQTNADLPFDSAANRPKGQNTLLIVPYFNGLNAVQQFSVRFTQMIFSRLDIPWPQA